MTFTRFSRLFFGGAIASLFFFSPCASGSSSGNPVVIGQAIDLSGPNGSIGRDYVAGIKTCFDMINARGGINGRQIDYIVRDDHGRPEQSVAAVTGLIAREQADYLLGGVGDAATKAVIDAPVFRHSGMALFAPLAEGDYPGTSRILFWRPAYSQEIDYLFAYFNKLGIDNVGVVYQDSPSNLAANLAADGKLTAALQARHMKLAGTARIGTDGDRIAQQARSLAASKPGFVLLLADTIGSALFLKEFRKHDAHTFVAGTSLTNLEMLRELAGAAAAEWTVFSQVVPNPNAGTSLLQIQHLDMMRKYRDEAVSSLTLEGFAAAKALAKAIEAKRSGYAALHDYFAQSGEIDLGGLSVAAANNGNRLSSYVDIALLQKGSGLLF